ncbi:MAG: hypothetical protein C4576_08770 [Desulfobacteraceae bacterium]|nr:MAG: hypothetical protein C4576_08770 [Desulfobacteraceae bacterium]
MKALTTLSGKNFHYKGDLREELIVYPSDGEGMAQDEFALAITPFTTNLVKSVIRERREILMGASRDNPPKNSLGSILKNRNQTPQQLSYLIPILIESGFCEYAKDGKAFKIIYNEG